MIRCDVCDKNSLLPEVIGTTNICKMCYMKINGPFWKKTYERYEDLNNQRKKVLESVAKYNFPPNVIDNINIFFNQQVNEMKCARCVGKRCVLYNQ